MSTHQDVPQTFHKYDSDDRKLLVNLLHEYSEKLSQSSRQIARGNILTRNAKEMMPILLPTLAINSMALLAFSFLNKQASNDALSGLFFIVIIGSFLFFILFLVKSSNSNYHLLKIENDLVERDARIVADRLELAMRLTVEISDQIETNLARKLELDSRIDEASYALEYYYSVVKPK
jgi:hypothetical protein